MAAEEAPVIARIACLLCMFLATPVLGAPSAPAQQAAERPQQAERDDGPIAASEGERDRYAEREKQAAQQAEFEGGRRGGGGQTTTIIIVLLVVILAILII